MKTIASRLPQPTLPSGWVPIASDRVAWSLAVYALVRRSVFVIYILLGFTGSVVAGPI